MSLKISFTLRQSVMILWASIVKANQMCLLLQGYIRWLKRYWISSNIGTVVLVSFDTTPNSISHCLWTKFRSFGYSVLLYCSMMCFILNYWNVRMLNIMLIHCLFKIVFIMYRVFCLNFMKLKDMKKINKCFWWKL